MSGSPVPPPVVCRSCGSPFHVDARVCPRCGAIPLVDHAVDRLRGAFYGLGARAAHAFSGSHGFLWIMALTPLVLAPPLTVIWLCLRKAGMSVRDERTASLLMIVAGLNVVVSLILLKWAGGAIMDQIAWLIGAASKQPATSGLTI